MRRDLLNWEAPYDIAAMKAGMPSSSEVILRFVATRTITFPAGFAESRGVAGTAATASTTFDVKRDGSNIGSLNYAISAAVATFTLTAPASFVAGEVLTIVAPASPDATLADIAITLHGFVVN